MRKRDAILLGALGGVGLLWGAKAVRRWRRRIDLTDRVVVITGASSGHGLIVARLAASRGAHLVIAARSIDQLHAAEPELIRAGARSVLSVATDVRDEAQARSLIDRTIAEYGHIDILINNAGIIQVGPLKAMTLDDFEQAMATNFWGAVHTTLAALPHMRAAGGGRIGNVVSFGGKVAAPHMAPYSASKFALAGFTQGLRSELAKNNIYVTGLYPGPMRTGGHANAIFKGDQKAEFTWFAISDSLPLASSSAETAAKRLLQGVCDGEAEVRVGLKTYLAAALQGLLPNETAELTALADRLLPASDNPDSGPVRGQDLDGPTPRWLNRMIPPATRPGPA
jgi:short-subunit dehydrogenase